MTDVIVMAAVILALFLFLFCVAGISIAWTKDRLKGEMHKTIMNFLICEHWKCHPNSLPSGVSPKMIDWIR